MKLRKLASLLILVAASACGDCTDEPQLVADPDPTPDTVSDVDGDGIPDELDNCWNLQNTAQRDSDGDGVGDLCDNCTGTANLDQLDSNRNGLGDVCDTPPLPRFTQEECYSAEFSPDVQTIEPSIAILLDASGSMADQLEPNRPQPWPIDQAVDAIAMVAGDLAGTARLGLSQFPHQSDVGSSCTTKQNIPVGTHTAEELAEAASQISPIGNTPTGFALNQALDEGVLDDPTDPLNERRPKGVILITDGDPTVACDSGAPINERVQAQPEAVAAAARLRAAGIPVFVIGFRSGALPANLNEIALAGGTDAPGADAFYVADDPNQLVAAIQDISDRIVSCSYQIDPPPSEMVGIAVAVDSMDVAEDEADGFSFDEPTNVVQLNGTSCSRIQNAADPASSVVEVTLTCEYPVIER